jgi:hypothetical protein
MRVNGDKAVDGWRQRDYKQRPIGGGLPPPLFFDRVLLPWRLDPDRHRTFVPSTDQD